MDRDVGSRRENKSSDQGSGQDLPPFDRCSYLWSSPGQAPTYPEGPERHPPGHRREGQGHPLGRWNLELAGPYYSHKSCIATSQEKEGCQVGLSGDQTSRPPTSGDGKMPPGYSIEPGAGPFRPTGLLTGVGSLPGQAELSAGIRPGHQLPS